MSRLVSTLAAAIAAALFMLALAGPGGSGGLSAATPEPRPDGGPAPTVIATVPPRPDVPAGFATPPPAGTPEPRPDGYVPTATPCAGGERMGCL